MKHAAHTRLFTESTTTLVEKGELVLSTCTLGGLTASAPRDASYAELHCEERYRDIQDRRENGLSPRSTNSP